MPLLCEPGTMRVGPFSGVKSSSSHTVLTITGDPMFNRSARISLCRPCSDHGRTMRAFRLPRMICLPRTCSITAACGMIDERMVERVERRQVAYMAGLAKKSLLAAKPRCPISQRSAQGLHFRPSQHLLQHSEAVYIHLQNACCCEGIRRYSFV